MQQILPSSYRCAVSFITRIIQNERAFTNIFGVENAWSCEANLKTELVKGSVLGSSSGPSSRKPELPGGNKYMVSITRRKTRDDVVECRVLSAYQSQYCNLRSYLATTRIRFDLSSFNEIDTQLVYYGVIQSTLRKNYLQIYPLSLPFWTVDGRDWYLLSAWFTIKLINSSYSMPRVSASRGKWDHPGVKPASGLTLGKQTKNY